MSKVASFTGLQTESMALGPNDKYLLLRLSVEGTLDLRAGKVDTFDALRMLLATMGVFVDLLQKETQSAITNPATGKPYIKPPGPNGSQAGPS